MKAKEKKRMSLNIIKSVFKGAEKLTSGVFRGVGKVVKVVKDIPG